MSLNDVFWNGPSTLEGQRPSVNANMKTDVLDDNQFLESVGNAPLLKVTVFEDRMGKISFLHSDKHDPLKGMLSLYLGLCMLIIK